MSEVQTARTYNQDHVARKYSKGHRRVSVYVAWSYPGEAGRDVTELDNRFSTMTEVRRVLWPTYEGPEWSDPMRFQQGIAGSLELFFWAWVRFQRVITEATGQVVPVFQRVDQAGFRLPLDERVLGDTDTLFVFGLDHVVTEQDATPEEIEAVRQFLAREGTCLVIGPHHDVGASEDMKTRNMEYAHHGDALVPRQQRFGTYTRALMEGLGIPVQNRWGLRPAVVPQGRIGSRRSVHCREGPRHPRLARGRHELQLPHAPAALRADHRRPEAPLHVLARQPIDLSRPHPFTNAGNKEFNAFVWMAPGNGRAGDVLVVDSTVFSTLFGSDESLTRFWKNLATAK